MIRFIKNLLGKNTPTSYPTSSVVWGGGNPFKGVVIPSPNNDVFITTRHYQIKPDANVHLILDDGTRFTTKVIEVISPDIQVNKTLPLADRDKDDRYWKGDISICKVETRFPIEPLKIEPIATGKIYVQHKDMKWSQHSVGYQKNWGQLFDLPNWIRTVWGKTNFTQGDSGLPWFKFDPKTKTWSIVGITSRTSISPTETPWSGESPKLGSPLILSTIERTIKN